MKSKQLHARLSVMAKSDNLLEVIKDCEMQNIKGGLDNCGALTSCETYVDCANKYKKGDKDTTISPDINIPIGG